MCLTTDTSFISTKLFFALKPNFHIFAEIHQKEMLKIHGIIPTSEFLYLIRNHANYTIKPVIHMINMKFSKLKKNNARNTNKT